MKLILLSKWSPPSSDPLFALVYTQTTASTVRPSNLFQPHYLGLAPLPILQCDTSGGEGALDDIELRTVRMDSVMCYALRNFTMADAWFTMAEDWFNRFGFFQPVLLDASVSVDGLVAAEPIVEAVAKRRTKSKPKQHSDDGDDPPSLDESAFIICNTFMSSSLSKEKCALLRAQAAALLDTKTEPAKEKRMAAVSREERLDELDIMEHKRIIDSNNDSMKSLEKQATLLKELTGRVPQTIIDSIVKIAENTAVSAVMHSQLNLDRARKRRLEEVDALQASAFGNKRHRSVYCDAFSIEPGSG
jgi:hypothetical protein